MIEQLMLRMILLALETAYLAVNTAGVMVDRFFPTRPPQPGPLKLVHKTSQDTMSQIFTAAFPPKSAPNVKHHEVTLTGATFKEGDATTQTFPEGTPATGEIKAPNDSTFSTSYVQIDSKGLRSDPVVQEHDASDENPPAQPGGLGMTFVRSEDDETPEA